jgi:hypothetical protein
MKKLRTYIGFLKEDIEGAEDYLHFASMAKTDDGAGAAMAVKLAEVELQHAKDWHDLIVQEIEKQKRMLAERGQEVPPMMLEWWKDEHADYVEKVSKLKHMAEMLKQ